MELRKDENGRPVGLQWPQAPEFTEEQIERSSKNLFNGNPWRGGKGRSKMCPAGLHDMDVHGRERKDGNGRYCLPCKTARQREWRKKNPESVKKSKEKYNGKHR